VLLSEENQDARDQCEDREKDTRGAKRNSEDSNQTYENKINRQQQHADVFCNHPAILNGWSGMSRANRFFESVAASLSWGNGVVLARDFR
jgi:hypothetical protein